MPPSLEFVLDFPQLGAHPLGHRFALYPEPSVLGAAAHMCEAQEVEGLGCPESLLDSSLGREPPELDQPRLLGVQLQPELRQSLAELCSEPFRVLPMFKARNVIIRVAHENHVPARFAAPPLLEPEVQDVVQIHVREQRRYCRSLRCPFFALCPTPVLDYSCFQPLLDESQDPLVRDTMLDKLCQPRVINSTEKVGNIRVEQPAHLLAFDPYCECVQRIVLAAPRSEAVGEAGEVCLVHGVDPPHHRPLAVLVSQVSDAERPFPPVPLGDVPPPRGLRSIRPAVQPPAQVFEVGLQVL